MPPAPKTVVVVGASRGIGAAVAQHFASQGDRVWSVCRSPAVAGEWIQADISGPEGVGAIAAALGDTPMEVITGAIDWLISLPPSVDVPELNLWQRSGDR